MRVISYYLKYWLLLMMMLMSFTTWAQLSSDSFNMQHLGYADGLNSLRVFSIKEDANDVIWIATKNGVNRYNGNVIRNYSLPGGGFNSDLAGRRIELFYNNRLGLWAYDNGGRIYKYSERYDCFELRYNLSNRITNEVMVYKMTFDAGGNIWLTLSVGLYRIDSAGRLTKVIHNVGQNDVLAVSNRLFCGTDDCIYQLTDGGRRKTIISRGHDAKSLFYDKQENTLWIGTLDNGLYVLNLNTKREIHIGNFHKPIRAIVGYDKHNMLIGTDGQGVYVVDKKKMQPSAFLSMNDNTDKYLYGNGIYAIECDREGNIWMGSYTGGVSVALLGNRQIVRYVHERGRMQSINSNNVNAVVEDASGNLWFGTESGLSVKCADGTWSHLLDNIVIVSMCKAANESMWIGTYEEGLFLVDRNGNIIRHLIKKNKELTSNSVFSVYEDNDGDLWIGALSGNLMLRRKNGLISQYPITLSQSIVPLDRSRVLVASGYGFYIIDKNKGILHHYFTRDEFPHTNISTYINDLLVDKDGSTVWLATEAGGIVNYNLRTHRIKVLTTHEGLPSNDVFSLLRTGDNRIWMGTGKGIAVMSKGRITSLDYIGDLYGEYNRKAAYILRNGLLAFGGNNGAVVFSPSITSKPNYKAKLRFTAFIPNFASAREKDKSISRIYDMLSDGKVKMDYWHNTFTINFEAINHRYQQDIAYQYYLEGYNNSWSDVSNEGSVTFTKVPSGRYTLRVRCVSASYRTILSEQSLQIVVGHPWWNTWLAWIFYIGGLTCVLFLIIRYKSNMLKKSYDEDKISFFTQMVHDIRTPITLIMTPLEDLSREAGLNENSQILLNLARKNTRRLYELITQLLDFEKFDSHKEISLAPLSLNDTIKDVMARFNSVFNEKQLKCIVSMPDEDISIMTDRKIVESILDNLISNACKYTLKNGEVKISLNASKQYVTITVADTGIGIPEKARKHIFTDIYRADNAKKLNEPGTGFGLLQVKRLVSQLKAKISFKSMENLGTTFTLTLHRIPTELPQSCVEKKENSDEVLPSWDVQLKLSDLEIKNTSDTSDNVLLIVEDNDELRYYLDKTLSRDYRVTAVPNGEEALAYLQDNYPDLILSDVMMPGIQGDELCRIVKENPATAGIPVILLTAKVNHEAMMAGINKGADDYIPKPFDTELLKAKIHGMIENRKRMREVFMREALNQVSVSSKENVPPSPVHKTPAEKSDVVIKSDADRCFIEKVTKTVMAHIPEEEFSINDLCREMAMSRTLFYCRLKSLTGKGPQEFIRILRLEKAATLLKSGLKVSDVAVQTGFTNSKYFSVLFKKAYGIEPSKYSSNED